MGRIRKRRKSQWVSELDDVVRGACGGFLFGIPLLYTMEVWWVGSFIGPPIMVFGLVLAYTIIFFLNRTAGFRKAQGLRLRDAAMESVEAIAIGIVCTTLVLVLLQEINSNVPLDEALGKIIFESIPFSIGVALANQYLDGGSPDQSSDRTPHNRRELNDTLSDIGATLVGAMIVGLNIAPTDEVAMLAIAIQGPWLLAIMMASLLISYGIVFEANFADQKKRMRQKGIFQRPMSETIASYLVSLLAAALMMWIFQQLSFEDPWTMWLRYTLVLGLPATIGGAAGRLAT